MNKHLLSLLHLTDPSLPIGGFAHSAGLETYVQQGIIYDAKTAKNYIIEMLSQNIKYNDAAFLALTYEAAINKDFIKIVNLDSTCNASKIPEEIRSASIKLGLRLHKILSVQCNSSLVKDFSENLTLKNINGHYAITFGIYSFVLNIALEDALIGFYYNTCAALVNNCVKLIPLGQQQGQEILFSLHSVIDELVMEGQNPDQKMLGKSCTAFDIRSMQHERLYSRLYMS